MGVASILFLAALRAVDTSMFPAGASTLCVERSLSVGGAGSGMRRARLAGLKLPG